VDTDGLKESLDTIVDELGGESPALPSRDRLKDYLDVIIECLQHGGGGGEGTVVIANPTLDGSEDSLIGIKIAGTKYKVSASQPIPTNLVTTDSVQEITAEKTFSAGAKTNELLAGDYYISGNDLAVKRPNSDEFDVIINDISETEQTTFGHMFNDTTNTAYIGGDTENPKYVTQEGEETKIYDIALKSDLPDVSTFVTKDTDSLTNYTKTIDLSIVATSGSYNDLADKPTIPSIEGLATETYVNEYHDGTKQDIIDAAHKLDYSLLSNTPTITAVEANPTAEATAELSKLKVGDSVYRLSGGGQTDIGLSIVDGLICCTYEEASEEGGNE